MVLAHSFDAWMNPVQRTGSGLALVKRHTSGIPSRLFLFLVGVSTRHRVREPAASAAARRPRCGPRPPSAACWCWCWPTCFGCRSTCWPGSGAAGTRCSGWTSSTASAPRCWCWRWWASRARAAPPTRRRCWRRRCSWAWVRSWARPISMFPDRWIPEPISAYVGGQRPMSWFALFPWGAWALVGLVSGTCGCATDGTPPGRPAASGCRACWGRCPWPAC